MFKITNFLQLILIVVSNSEVIYHEQSIGPKKSNSHFLIENAYNILGQQYQNVDKRTFYKAHLNAVPSFIITPSYTANLLASPQVTEIKAAINAAITAYQSVISSTGTANIVFDVMTSGLGKEAV